MRMPPTSGVDLPHLRRAEGEVKRVSRAGDKVVGAADHVGHENGLDVLLAEIGRRQHRADGRLQRTHRGKSVRDALALEVRNRADVAVLAYEEPDAQRVRCGDDAQVFEALRQTVVHLHRVGDADLGLAAGDHGDDHLVSGGRLHEHVEPRLLFEHLGHRRCRRVIEGAGLQRGEAIGLRVRCCGASRDGDDGDQRAGQAPRRCKRTACGGGLHGPLP